MDLLELNEIKKSLQKRFQENFLEETMDIKGDLKKILADFYKVENTGNLSKEQLLERRNEAINNLDIENLKNFEEKLNSINDLEKLCGKK